MNAGLDHYSQEQIKNLMQDDQAFVKLCNEGREALFSAPTQSHFRVYAILVIEKVDGSLCLIRGANSEHGYIGGAICAERSALCNLRFIKDPIVREVVVVTDSDTATSPGVLCREFLMSFAQPITPVVMGNAVGSIVTRCPLHDLWPHPYEYRYQDRDLVVTAAKAFASRIEQTNSPLSPTVQKLMTSAQSCNHLDHLDALHPIRLSAALLFDDGSIETAWMLKGLEYGNTLDPVTQLVRDIERRRICAPCSAATDGAVKSVLNILQAGIVTKPVILVMCDQFGVAHAPFAQARCLLTEHGYEYVQVLVHDSEGVLCTATAGDLVPQPEGTKLVSCDIFR